MVVRRTTYPQVEPRAAELMTSALAIIPARLSIEEAARVARRRRALLLAVRLGAGWGGVTPATLEHALALGLHRVPVQTVLWGAPLVAPDTPEVTARRRLRSGTPFLLVGGPGGPVGAVLVDSPPRALPLSAVEALARLPEPTARLLRRAGELGDELGCPVVMVGGLARDLLFRGVPPERADLDLVVDGDGPALARRLGAELGAAVREHPAFLTATVEPREGRRIDVAVARSERYAVPGALPEVEPASLANDLWRRDFSVNALALRLNRGVWGEVVDPTGGLADLRRRRLRILHPLSFVEDPTRMFRAIRLAVRLGCRLEPTTRRLLRHAAALDVYGALSGDRLHAEVAAVLAEPDPATVLVELGRQAVFRLLLRGYRFSASAARLVRQVAERARALPVTPEVLEGLHLLALTAHLESEAARAWAARLGMPPGTRARLEEARRDAPALAATLGRARTPAEAYAALRDAPELVAAWAGVATRPLRVRRHVREHLARWRTLRPLLTGHDLVALGLSPGPEFRRLLDDLRLEQIAGRVRDRAEALDWVRTSARSASPEPHGVTHRRRSDTQPAE